MSYPKQEIKPYKCTGCGTEKEIRTNHYGQCYPYCSVCCRPTVWECALPKEEWPDDAWVPEPWTMMTLEEAVKAAGMSMKNVKDVKDILKQKDKDTLRQQ